MSDLATIESAFYCSCDSEAVQGGLLSVDAALRKGLALAKTVDEMEQLPLAAAHGRVLGEAICAKTPLPLFDNSAMDGYAVRCADLVGEGPWELPVTGRIAAGDAGNVALASGSAMRIFTGAPVPPGCDAVIMQEMTQLDGNSIRIERCPKAGENIRRAGEDIAQGAELLPQGRVIDPRAATLLAAAGCGEIMVRRRIRVAFFSTGSELRDPGDALAPGQIWNANRSQLQGVLQQPWIEAIDLGMVTDEPELLRQALETAAQKADLVVTTGGVSVGDEDHMPAMLAAAGGVLDVIKVAMKPGKPLTIGHLGNAVYIGLPGNPVSAFVTWHVIGARIAEKLAGLAISVPERNFVRASFARTRQPGRCEFLPATLGRQDGHGLRNVEIATASVSHRVALLAQADGLVLIPAETDEVKPGDLLEFLPF